MAESITFYKAIEDLGDVSYKIPKLTGRWPFRKNVDTEIAATPHFFPMEETGFPQAIQKIKRAEERRTDSKSKIHLGVGGMQNITIAIETGCKYCLLMDINAAQKPFWEEIFRLARENYNSKDFYYQLKHAFETGRIFAKGKNEYEDDLGLHQEANPWFFNDESYLIFRAMVLEGRIAAVHADIMDAPRILMIAEVLPRFGRTQSQYISNLIEFFERGGGFYDQLQQASVNYDIFFQNLRLLAGDNKDCQHILDTSKPLTKMRGIDRVVEVYTVEELERHLQKVKGAGRQ